MYIIFFFVWIIFNGRITTEIVIFGLVIAALIFAFICKFMDYSIAKEKLLYKKIGIIGSYLKLLVVEIVKANITVIRMVFNQKERIEPVIVKFRTNLQSETARVVLANSITLTPGTITVSLEGDELTVHCLDASLAQGMEDSEFVKLLEKLEGKEQ